MYIVHAHNFDPPRFIQIIIYFIHESYAVDGFNMFSQSKTSPFSRLPIAADGFFCFSQKLWT